MIIKTCKFSYEVTINTGRILHEGFDYVSNARDFIREKSGNPSFEFPTYFKCSVKYSLLTQEPSDGYMFQWKTHYKKFIGKSYEYAGRDDLIIESLNFERYTYNKRNIPLIKPETQLTDALGLEEFHSVEAALSVMSYNQENGIWRALHNQKVLCEVTVRYSDDDFFESDEKRKKIYLVNLNFGYRRSRRNNKNMRKYRNRY